ncbi:MAG: palmitoyltransferase for Vac8p [Cirrosporium novae-zelandiae]|nr:MAG: palmitoyltransferase for Vac8p [Cirrosporium novae-zelandiae]
MATLAQDVPSSPIPRRRSKACAPRACSTLGIILCLLLNWSYTTAVFTDPGSPLTSKNGYSHLPTHEPITFKSVTVSSTGETRFCKKCEAQKPDRAHHCSTCGRCVLKMDHHCPWLATCVGLHNYKAFILFLVYTSLFCWTCLLLSASWLWCEILSDGQWVESLMPVNYVLLVVISGIIGLVLTGFTCWHIWLSIRGQTTIECLEKTRYLSPLRKAAQHHHFPSSTFSNISDSEHDPPSLGQLGQQLYEIHANALPGITRPEEGESRHSSPSPSHSMSHSSSPAHRSLSQHATPSPYNSFVARERERERDRYSSYLDEQASESLPNAWDLGWRRNLVHLFGPIPLLWFFPICNTTGDGWNWEPSQAWVEARERVRKAREEEWEGSAAVMGYNHSNGQQQMAGRGRAPIDSRVPNWRPQLNGGSGGNLNGNGNMDGAGADNRHWLMTSTGPKEVPTNGKRSPGKADQILGRKAEQYADHESFWKGEELEMQRRGEDIGDDENGHDTWRGDWD